MQLDLFIDSLRRPLKRRARFPSSYEYQGSSIVVSLVRSRRRKYMAIHVVEGGGVEIRAPFRCPNYELDAFIRSRLDWIAKARKEMSERAIKPELDYKQGAKHSYLGEMFHLCLVPCRAGTRRSGSVMRVNDQLVITTADPGNGEKTKMLIQMWYKNEAVRLFPRRMEYLLGAIAPELSLPSVPPVVVRKMKSRWGSCSPQGVICLNSLLIQKPLSAIDFVMVHELCHLKHFNHSRKFYGLMDRLMPDWKSRERLLSDRIL